MPQTAQWLLCIHSTLTCWNTEFCPQSIFTFHVIILLTYSMEQSLAWEANQTLPSPICTTCPTHLILLYFITRTTVGEEYGSWSSSNEVFSTPMIPRSSQAQIFSLTSYSQTPSAYVPGRQVRLIPPPVITFYGGISKAEFSSLCLEPEWK
jgi:hypothetical protein